MVTLATAVACGELLGLDEYDGPQIAADTAASSGVGAQASSSGVGGGGSGGTNPCGAYCQAVIAERPLAYWRFGEARGAAEAVDWSGNGNTALYEENAAQGGDLVFGAAALIDDPTNTALEVHNGLDGFSADVYLGDKLDFGGTLTFSIEAWVKPQQDFEYAVIVRKVRYVSGGAGGGATTVPGEGYELSYGQPQTFRFARWTNQVGALVEHTVASVGVRYVVVNYDGSSLFMWIDGMLADTETDGAYMNDNDGGFVMGPAMRGGVIDEVAVYAQPMSSDRIQAHYDLGTP